MQESLEVPAGESLEAALERLAVPAGRFTVASGTLERAVLGHQDLDSETYRTVTLGPATVDSIEGEFHHGDDGDLHLRAAAVVIDEDGATHSGRLVEAKSAGDLALVVTAD